MIRSKWDKLDKTHGYWSTRGWNAAMVDCGLTDIDIELENLRNERLERFETYPLGRLLYLKFILKVDVPSYIFTERYNHTVYVLAYGLLGAIFFAYLAYMFPIYKFEFYKIHMITVSILIVLHLYCDFIFKRS